MIMNSNKSRTYKKRNYYRGGEQYTTCSICHDDITETNSCTTSCNHQYHLFCFIDWHKHNKTCPICRAELITPNEQRERQNEVAPETLLRDNMTRSMRRIGLSEEDTNRPQNERSAMYINRISEIRQLARGRRRIP